MNVMCVCVPARISVQRACETVNLSYKRANRNQER